MKEKILQLRLEGYTYPQIAKTLECSKSTVSYYLSEGQKQKTLTRNNKNRKAKLRLDARVSLFKSKRAICDKTRDFRKKTPEYLPASLTIKEAREVLESQNYRCYLTGIKLDLANPRSFHFDHIIPLSKGGSSTKENLGICLREANHAKNDLLIDDLMLLCKAILKHHKRLK